MNRIVWIFWLLGALGRALSAEDPGDSLALNSDGGNLCAEWFGRNGWTYTVQESEDLWHWDTLEAVITGVGSAETLAVSPAGDRRFLRLRSSASGDTNFNGLPDLWEWTTFGFLDVDPEKDPDGDGTITFDEYIAGSNPLDFFNGEPPQLIIRHPTSWMVPAGDVSQQALDLVVRRPDGSPWANAPVIATVTDGTPALMLDDATGGPPEVSLEFRTDQQGRINPWFVPVRFLAPETPEAVHQLRLDAGMATSCVDISITDGRPPEPPRAVRVVPGTNGSITVSWAGDPSGAQSISLETRQTDGSWALLADISAGDLPVPDPDTGRYTLTLDP